MLGKQYFEIMILALYFEFIVRKCIGSHLKPDISASD